MKATSLRGQRAHPVIGRRFGVARYDPWLDLHDNWPGIWVVVEKMDGDLLGELRLDEGVIAIRAGTSAAQSRCTLAHEIVHLERGLRDCGPWLEREERAVHSTAARRLISIDDLIDAVRELGGTADRGALAHLLEVDSETLTIRLAGLDRGELREIRQAFSRCSALWSVA